MVCKYARRTAHFPGDKEGVVVSLFNQESINTFALPATFKWPDFRWLVQSVRQQAANRYLKTAYVWYEHVKQAKGTRHKRCPKLRNVKRQIAIAIRVGILKVKGG